MYRLLIIGAGPGGIGLAAEATAVGTDSDQILILEKAQSHNWAIGQLYPEQKITTANYKGFEAKCEGLLCLGNMTSNIKRVDEDHGHPIVVFEEQTDSPRMFDRVIYALGGTTPVNFLRTLGIAFNDNGPIFDDAGATNVPGLYLLGDLVVGKKGGSIITAFNSSVRAMRRICANELTCSQVRLLEGRRTSSAA